MVAMESSRITTASASADDRQAEYFMHLLTRRRQRIEQRIDDLQKAMAIAEARGNADDVRRLRRMTLLAEQDRRTVADLTATTGSIAAEQERLRQAFAELPSTLAAADQTMRAVPPAVDSTVPLLRDLR